MTIHCDLGLFVHESPILTLLVCSFLQFTADTTFEMLPKNIETFSLFIVKTQQLQFSSVTCTQLHAFPELASCLTFSERIPILCVPWLMNLDYPATFSHVPFDTVPYPCLFLGVLAPARAILQTPQVPKSERPYAIYTSIRVGTFDSLNLCQLHKPKQLAINWVSHTTR